MTAHTSSTALAQAVQAAPDPREFFPALTLLDRCEHPDSETLRKHTEGTCNAQAFVQVLVGHRQFKDAADPSKGVTTNKTGATILVFCKHHYLKHEEHFVLSGYAVRDDSDQINEKPSPGNADIPGAPGDA